MKAAVILQKCSKSRKTFGIRVQQMEDGEWYRTWSFPMDEKRASREGYDRTQIMSRLPALREYPGCPYCEGQSFFYDTNCGKISCFHGENSFTCPWCNGHYDNLCDLTDKLEFTGGDR